MRLRSSVPVDRKEVDDPGREDEDVRVRSLSLTISVSWMSSFFGETSSVPGARFRRCLGDGEGGGGMATELGIRTRAVN